MLVKQLSSDEKLVFGRNLHECATLAVKSQVMEEYHLATGYSAQSYKDKMCGHRKFAVLELDIIIAAFRRAYGEEPFVTRFRENFDALPYPPYAVPEHSYPTDCGYDPRLPVAGKDQFVPSEAELMGLSVKHY